MLCIRFLCESIDKKRNLIFEFDMYSFCTHFPINKLIQLGYAVLPFET